jgi:uncharacterized membrane protein
VRKKLLDMQQEYLIELEDAVVAAKQPNGQVKLNQLFHPARFGAASGALWGTLVGLIFMMPLVGTAIGAAGGAIGGALTDAGINDQFMKDAAQALQSGNAALFLLIRKMTTDKVLEALQGVGGVVMRTSFDHTKEEALRKALADHAAGSSGPGRQRSDDVFGHNRGARRPARVIGDQWWHALDELAVRELRRIGGPTPASAQLGYLLECVFRGWPIVRGADARLGASVRHDRQMPKFVQKATPSRHQLALTPCRLIPPLAGFRLDWLHKRGAWRSFNKPEGRPGQKSIRAQKGVDFRAERSVSVVARLDPLALRILPRWPCGHCGGSAVTAHDAVATLEILKCRTAKRPNGLSLRALTPARKAPPN